MNQRSSESDHLNYAFTIDFVGLNNSTVVQEINTNHNQNADLP
jgi:hypothetical protein